MSSRNLTAIEGLRFLLFLGVFVFHGASHWCPIGWGGVEAFLVIGAYFLTSKYLKREQRDIAVGKAFVGRIKRLYPVYVVLIIAAVVFNAVTIHQINADSLWYLFSLQNFRCLFLGSWNSLDGFLGHFWYIGLDVWLFLLWVVLLRFVPRNYLRKFFVSTLILGLVWRTTFILLKPENVSLAYVIPIGQLDCWSLGGILAINVKQKGEQNKNRMKADLFIGICGIVALIVYNSIHNDYGILKSIEMFRNPHGYMHNIFTGNIHFFIALTTVGIVRYCMDNSLKHPLLSSLPLVALGGMTYELYCFHYPIIYCTKQLINNQLLMVFVSLLATCVVTLLWRKFATPVFNKLFE